jgi:hypothetical protein
VNRRENFQRFFPAPLVATVLLLVLLILLTPVLVPNGPPAAGTIFTQAVLTVDRPPSSNLTTFYLRGLSTTVRYSEIDVWVATGFQWTYGFPSPPLNWSKVADQGDLVALQFNASANPIALNVTMLYSTAGSQAYYVGEFAFFIGPLSGAGPDSFFSVTTTSGTSLAGGVNVESLSALPSGILLADAGGSP